MMSRRIGKAFGSELDHIKQSINDILTTPIGSRIMRRDYGSRLADFIDQPMSDALILQCYSAIYISLLIWEPRISITNISIIGTISHKFIIDMDLIIVDLNQQASLSIPLSFGATV